MKPTASLFNPDPVSGYLVVFIDGKQYTINSSDNQFAKATDAFKAENWTELFGILNPAETIKNLYAKYEQVEVKDGNVYVFGDAVNTLIAERILQFLDQGIDCVPVFKFLTKLQANPSSRACNELYTFLEHRNLPITDNGNFLAYKAVRSDYTDVHTGQFLNTVGQVLSMQRNKVDDNKENGCSYGFHAGTLEYASGFRPQNGKMVIVEIDPSDVVSIPLDSDCQKLRTCRYKVIGEYEDTLTKPLYESRFKTENDPNVNLQWDNYEEDEPECEECGYFESECQCSEYPDELEGGCMGDPDNWKNEKIHIDDLLSTLFKNRRPAMAMKIRKAFGSRDFIAWLDVEEILGIDDTDIVYREFNKSF